MRRFLVLKYFALICIVISSILLYSNKVLHFRLKFDAMINESLKYENKVSSRTVTKPSRIVISIVVCDSKLNQAFNAIKSVLLFTRTPVYFVIFTQDQLMFPFKEKLNMWNKITNNSFSYELQKIQFPNKNVNYWLNLFKKCAAQRLFIPNIITHIDSLIYIDVDVVFLGPVEELWNEFSKFNELQMSALASEVNNPSISWYPRFAKHPYYGKYGLNSGVMLMNLTRMRNFNWEALQIPIASKWKHVLPWGDQDIINIIFHYFPQTLYEMSCRFNYRSDQCMYGDACKDATEMGILVVHGSRNAFVLSSTFMAVNKAFTEYNVGDNPQIFMNKLIEYINKPFYVCFDFVDSFLKIPIDYVKKLTSSKQNWDKSL